MAGSITPDQARAELERRRRAREGGGSAITPDMARQELARRRAAREGSGQSFEGGVPVGGNANVRPDGPNRAGMASAGVDKFGGAAMNVTAGANEALYGVAGLPVDVMRGAMNLGLRGVNAATGADLPLIPENSFGGSRSIAEGMGAVRPELDPQNTVAATPGERVYRGVGQGVAGTMLPAGLVGAGARAGLLSQQGAQMGAQAFGRSSSVGAVGGDALAGGAAGAGAAFGTEMAPEGYAPLAALAGGLSGGLAGAGLASLPTAIREGASMAGGYLEPLTTAGQQRMAGRAMLEAAQSGGAGDPRAFDAPAFSRQEFIDSLPGSSREIVPGSRPTTFQATGNMGIGALERSAQTRDPVPFQQRRGEQNVARREALDTLQPTGAAENVSRALRQRLAQIEAETSGDVDMTMATARGRNEAIGRSMSPEDAGDTLRENLQRRRGLAVEKERRLWQAVDPDGSLALPAANTTRTARDTVRTIPASAKPPSGEEAAIYDVLGRYGDVVPFGELTALRSRLSTAMADERGRHGKSATWARMSELRGAIEKDIDVAVTTKVQRETEAVAAGTMREEDTVAANFQRQAEEWFAERQARASAGDVGSVSLGQGGRTGSSASFGVPGTTSQAGRGLSGPPRDPRLSPDGLEPNFDRAAQERLNRATDATRQRADTFDGRQLGPMLARPADHASYNMESARVASRAFTPGANGFERMQAVRRALGPNSGKAYAALEGYAIDTLRRQAMREDGTLDPAKVQAWRRSYSEALRAFPELDIRVQDAASASETMARYAATRKQAIENVQKGAVGRLIGTDEPQDVSRIVGGLFGRQNSMQEFARLRSMIGDDKQALEGLRKATAEYLSTRLVTNTEGATTGTALLSADQFQTFVRQNGAALSTIFSSREIEMLRHIGADLQRANRSLTAVRIPGQSNTAQDSPSMLGRIMQAGAQNREAIGGAAFGGSIGGLPGVLIGGVGASVLSNMRQAGINTVDDLVRDALLDPAKARMLLMRVPDEGSAALERTLAQRYRATSVATAGMGEDERRSPMTEVTVTPRRD